MKKLFLVSCTQNALARTLNGYLSGVNRKAYHATDYQTAKQSKA
jgi:hypothetical protein